MQVNYGKNRGKWGEKYAFPPNRKCTPLQIVQSLCLNFNRLLLTEEDWIIILLGFPLNKQSVYGSWWWTENIITRVRERIYKPRKQRNNNFTRSIFVFSVNNNILGEIIVSLFSCFVKPVPGPGGANFFLLPKSKSYFQLFYNICGNKHVRFIQILKHISTMMYSSGYGYRMKGSMQKKKERILISI